MIFKHSNLQVASKPGRGLMVKRVGVIALIATATVMSAPQVATSQTSPLTAAQQQRGQEVTRKMTTFLQRRISSPQGKLTLVIRPGARPDLGQFSEVVISGSPIRLKKKLQISEFSMRARNVRIDTVALMRRDDVELHTLAATTTLRAVITEDDLTSMLAKGRRSADMKLRVNFNGGNIRVAGNWKWGWFNGPVVAIGKLRLVRGANGNQVYFDISSLTLNGAQVPAFIKSKFSDQLNPLISYDDLPFLPQIRTIRFVGKKAFLST